jgi:chorismate mutase
MNESVSRFWNNRPMIISGPCSAETAQQVMDTAIEISKNPQVGLFRAGIWKPRTKPGMFEGVGAPALAWLKDAKAATGIPTTIEVATAAHVELALKHEVDVLWIGARTTTNPFSVQEIASALDGIDVPVLIKNPINPDIELWVGALERIEKTGKSHLGLVHRGFTEFGNTIYRNAPMWQLPIEMKRRYPNIPLICDPSHISGNRQLLQSVAQTSIDLDFSGLMIESHITPDEAWSDAAQQITPAQLSTMLLQLIWRSAKSESEQLHESLDILRTKIDEYDNQLIELLAERMKMADQIGAFKKENNITILQSERWNQILDKILAKANQLGLSETFVRKYIEAVHLESINHQNKIMNNS